MVPHTYLSYIHYYYTNKSQITVPLAAVKNAYNSCEHDVCADWFHFETSGCNIKKSVLDELVYEYFGDGNTIKFQPPILIDGQPSTTYFKVCTCCPFACSLVLLVLFLVQCIIYMCTFF